MAALSSGLHVYRAGGREKLREEHRCRLCGRRMATRPYRHAVDRSRVLTRHHLVPKSWFDANGLSFTLRDADANIVPLCRRCHDDVEHDRQARKMLRKMLGPNEVAFAVQLRGAEWFERIYPPSVRIPSRAGVAQEGEADPG